MGELHTQMLSSRADLGFLGDVHLLEMLGAEADSSSLVLEANAVKRNPCTTYVRASVSDNIHDIIAHGMIPNLHDDTPCSDPHLLVFTMDFTRCLARMIMGQRTKTPAS